MANEKVDAVIVGAGASGSVFASVLAKAGKKVVVVERRHVLGGAAVTEEIVPGFLFSECSYVVSLLRPEIIRELDLPRHGLEILPLDGTFSPMLNEIVGSSFVLPEAALRDVPADLRSS